MVKPEEILVEAWSDTDVQIVRTEVVGLSSEAGCALRRDWLLV
jgi:hypothetical protein